MTLGGSMQMKRTHFLPCCLCTHYHDTQWLCTHCRRNTMCQTFETKTVDNLAQNTSNISTSTTDEIQPLVSVCRFEQHILAVHMNTTLVGCAHMITTVDGCALIDTTLVALAHMTLDRCAHMNTILVGLAHMMTTDDGCTLINTTLVGLALINTTLVGLALINTTLVGCALINTTLVALALINSTLVGLAHMTLDRCAHMNTILVG